MLENLLTVGIAVLIAYAAILWLGIAVWAYRDIRERTHDSASQVMAVLLVFLFNVPGIILYLILRPHETLTESYERRLESEALIRDLAEARRSCPNCQHAVQEDFLLCPHCRTQLQAPCSECGKALELDWSACPYCGTTGPQAASAPPAVSAATAMSQPPEPDENGSPAPTTAKASPASPRSRSGSSSKSRAEAKGRGV